MKYTSIILCIIMLIAPGLTQIDLGTAAAYGALAVASISNNGYTSISGKIGTTGSTITGFPPGKASGSIEIATTAVDEAWSDALKAYNTAQSLNPDTTAASEDLGGSTLQAGVYRYTGSVLISGDLTLSGAGTYVFQIGGSLTTMAGSSIVLSNGAEACDVYWVMAGSATLGASTAFLGNILTEGSITFGAGASTRGGLYSRASITLDDNVVDIC